MNIKSRLTKVINLLLVFLLTCLMGVKAQSTTSSVAGIATDNEGALAGALITIVHVPSGTRYTTVANHAGNYRFEGLRTGGPYRLEASYVGHKKAVVKISHLYLGQVHLCDVKLPEGSELAEVTIIGRGAQERKTGASENFTTEEMQRVATVDRRIEDMLRLSPYYIASGAFGGRDAGMNNYSIDGANFNYNMGLDRMRMPGGGHPYEEGYSGTPFSLDAIEEIQVVSSDFDVKNSNFLGASVNAVTKSCTNVFRASAYTLYKDERLRGNRVDGTYLGKRNPQQCNIYGLTLGGPIIKDKLFYFVSAELENVPKTLHNWKLSTDGVGNAATNTSRVTAADMQQFASDLKSMYGWDPGSYDDFEGNNKYIRLMARLDWNISDKHRLMLRYNHIHTDNDNNVKGGSLGLGHPVSIYSQSFSGSTWKQIDNVYSLTAELNSRLNASMTNKLTAGFTFNDANNRECDADFPTIDIMKPDDAGTLRPFMNAGYDQHSWNNGINEKSWNITDNFTWSLDDHFLSFGAAFESVVASNCYMRYGAGYYRYASYDDFVNKRAPSAFAMCWSLTGDERALSDVTYNRFSLYAQDEWRVNPRLRLLYGVRMDLPMYVNDRYENPSVVGLQFGNSDLNTSDWPKAVPMISPRVGFNYDLTKDGKIKLRGGTGIFTGRFPLIFLSKLQENSGMIQTSVQINNASHALLPYLEGGVRRPQQVLSEVVPNLPDNLKSLFPTEPGAVANLTTIDRNFKMPQVWKTTLAVDYTLPVPFPAVFTLEGTFAKDINALTIRDLNIDPAKVEANRFAGPDDRFFYPGAAAKRYDNVTNENGKPYTGYAYELTNTNKGYSANIVAQLKAEPLKNLNVMAAYTYTVSKTMNSMASSNVDASTLPTVNGYNYQSLHNARYVYSPHRLIASASYRFNSSCDKASTLVSLFYEGRRNNGYSITYDGDMNNDGINQDLIYVPASKDELIFQDKTVGGVTFNAADQREAFWNFINQDPYLSDRKGKYTEPWSAYNPWFNRFDLRLSREYSIKVGKSTNRLQFSFDILNVGNLINSNWGVTKIVNNAAAKPLKRVGVTADNQPIYTMSHYTDTDGKTKLIDHTFDVVKNYQQCWRMQIGVKYTFN